MLESAVLGFGAGVVGGLVAAGLRLLHLEMEWHQVRRDLRRYYAQGRADRAREIERKPDGPLTTDDVLQRARAQGLTFDAFAKRLQRG